MIIFLTIVGILVLYLLGMAGFYGLCFYLFGKPDGTECNWWDGRTYHSDARNAALIFYPFVLPFMLARLVGFKQRMALLQPPPKALDDTTYKVGAWKEVK